MTASCNQCLLLHNPAQVIRIIIRWGIVMSHRSLRKLTPSTFCHALPSVAATLFSNFSNRHRSPHWSNTTADMPKPLAAGSRQMQVSLRRVPGWKPTKVCSVLCALCPSMVYQRDHSRSLLILPSRLLQIWICVSEDSRVMNIRKVTETLSAIQKSQP